MDNVNTTEVLFSMLLVGLIVYVSFVGFLTYRRQNGHGSTRETKIVISAEVLFLNGIGVAFQIDGRGSLPICVATFALLSLITALMTWRSIEGAQERWLTLRDRHMRVAEKITESITRASHKKPR